VKATLDKATVPCTTHVALWRKTKRGVNGRAGEAERECVCEFVSGRIKEEHGRHMGLSIHGPTSALVMW